MQEAEALNQIMGILVSDSRMVHDDEANHNHLRLNFA